MADESSPKNKLQVFLCYSLADKPAVVRLYSELIRLEWVKPWLDEEDLIAGQSRELEITRVVRASHAVIVCLSQKAVTEAGFRHKEIKFALDKADELPEGSIFIIPIKLEECNIPDRLSHLHTIKYYEERGHERLLKALRVQAEQLGIVQNEEAVRQHELQVAREEIARLEVWQAAFKAREAEREEAERQEAERQTREVAKALQPRIEPLLAELADLRTDHKRRLAIGEKLAELGDPRPGVGIDSDSVPDIAWLGVVPGGQIEVAKQKYNVAPFYIAQYPVTFVQFKAFVEASDGYNNDRWWQGLERKQPENQSFNGINKPRDNVSWYQAVAFTRWLTYRMQGRELPLLTGVNVVPVIGQNVEIRLPLKREWQWAAQGGQEQCEYPWGKWQEGYANTSEAQLKQTIAVGMYPQGAAICGAMDMCGQVWEWCLNKYSKNSESRVRLGGSFLDRSLNAAASVSFHHHPYYFSHNCGFRLVVASPIAPSDL